MVKRLLSIIALIAFAVGAAHCRPLYFVGGVQVAEIVSIDQENIVSIIHLDPTEEVIKKYGAEASDGVVLIELKHDSEALFRGGMSFRSYLESTVEWPEKYGAAQVIVRFKIGADGALTPLEALSSTNSRLRRRVEKAIEQSVGWQAATKDGEAIESEQVVRVLLPRGAQLPREQYIIMR